MRSIRTLLIAVCATAAMFALAAGSGSAIQVKDSVSTNALAVGSSVFGATTGSSSLTGSFFGIPGTVKCTASFVAGTILANPDPGGIDAWGSIDTLTWTGCQGPFGTCNVTANGLPWTPNTTNGTGGGLEATTSTTVNIGTGTSGAVDMTNCLGQTCTLKGSLGPTSTPTGFELTNYLSASWTNFAADQLSINSTNIVASPSTCTQSPRWTATYRLTDSAGNPVILN